MPTSYKKCPNPECEGKRASIRFTTNPIDWGQRGSIPRHGWIQCYHCAMRGPTGENKQEAKQLWNNLPRY